MEAAAAASSPRSSKQIFIPFLFWNDQFFPFLQVGVGQPARSHRSRARPLRRCIEFEIPYRVLREWLRRCRNQVLIESSNVRDAWLSTRLIHRDHIGSPGNETRDTSVAHTNTHVDTVTLDAVPRYDTCLARFCEPRERVSWPLGIPNHPTSRARFGPRREERFAFF